MGGNWIACSYALQPNWLLWVCGVKSYFQALNAKGLLSHSCRVHFLQPFPSTPAPVSPGPADGCWKGSGGGGSGALVFMGKWPIPTLCGNPESLRWGRENKVDVEFGINCSFTIVSEKCPGTAVRCTCHTLSTCANWMRRGFIFRLRHICISPVNVTITRRHPTKVLFFLLTFWFFLFLAAAVDILLLICMFGTPLSHPTTMIIGIFILMPRSCPTAGNIWKTYHNTFFLKRKKERKTANWVTKKWLTSSCRAGGSVHLGPILHSSAHLQPNYNHQLHQQFLPPLMWQLLCRTYKQSNECISNLIIDFSWPVHFPNNTIKQILIKEDLLFYGSWSHEVLLSEY